MDSKLSADTSNRGNAGCALRRAPTPPPRTSTNPGREEARPLTDFSSGRLSTAERSQEAHDSTREMRSSIQKNFANQTFTRMTLRWLCAERSLIALLQGQRLVTGTSTPTHRSAFSRAALIVRTLAPNVHA